MAHEKRLLIDVFQAYFYKKQKDGTRKLVFMSENLTSGGIVTSQENTDVRNGQGNTLFAVLPGTKDVTVNLTENVFSFEALELNTGSARVAGTKNVTTGNSGLILKRPGKYKANELETNKSIGGTNNLTMVKLDHIPLNIKDLVVNVGEQQLEYDADPNNLAGQNKYSLAKRTISPAPADDFESWDGATPIEDEKALYLVINDAKFTDLKLDTAESLKILPYVYTTRTTTSQVITIKSNQFSEGGELWLQTLEKDEKQKARAYVYFVFENAMPEGNFEINTVSEVQPNDMTVNMRILANEDGELYRIVREEIPQN